MTWHHARSHGNSLALVAITFPYVRNPRYEAFTRYIFAEKKEKYILLILISCCTVYKSVFKSYFSSETETPSLKKICEEYADFVVENTEAADMKKE